MNFRIIICLLFPIAAFSQSQPLTIDQAVQLAVAQNKGLQSTAAAVAFYKEMARTSAEIPKTQLSMQYGQNNSYANDNNFSVSQTIPFPTLFAAKKQLNEAQTEKAVWQKAATQNDLIFQVKQVYVQLLYLREQRALLTSQDSLFTSFSRSAALRYKTGESRLIEKTAAEVRLQEVRNLLRQNEADEQIFLARLQALLGSTTPVSIADASIPAAAVNVLEDSMAVADNPQLHFAKQDIDIAGKQKKVISAGILPDLTVGYFNQSLIGTPVNASGAPLASSSNRFQGVQVGLALPLWLGPMKARVKAEEKQQQAAGLFYDNSVIQLKSQYRQAVQEFVKLKNSLDYYSATALPNADQLQQQTVKSFVLGDIGYAEYFLNLEKVMSVRQGYLQTRHDIKQSELYIVYLSGHQR